MSRLKTQADRLDAPPQLQQFGYLIPTSAPVSGLGGTPWRTGCVPAQHGHMWYPLGVFMARPRWRVFSAAERGGAAAGFDKWTAGPLRGNVKQADKE